MDVASEYPIKFPIDRWVNIPGPANTVRIDKDEYGYTRMAIVDQDNNGIVITFQRLEGQMIAKKLNSATKNQLR